MANKNTARLARQDRKAEQDDRLAAVDAASKADRRLFKQFSAEINDKSVDETQRTVKFIITTGNVDRDNDTIDPKGWDLSDFLRSPSILWAHDYSQLPVARALDVVQTPDGLQSTAQFPPKGISPLRRHGVRPDSPRHPQRLLGRLQAARIRAG
jgi:hypothetical protein